MKRWPFTAAEHELVTLFTERGYVGAKVYDADHGPLDASTISDRFWRLLERAESRRDALDAGVQTSDDVVRVESARVVFVQLEPLHRAVLSRAYGPRRWKPVSPPRISRKQEDDCDPMVSHFTEGNDIRHYELTAQGLRTLNLLPLTEVAQDAVGKGATHAEHVVYAYFQKLAASRESGAITRFRKLRGQVEAEAEALVAGPSPYGFRETWQAILQQREENARRVSAGIPPRPDAAPDSALAAYEILRRDRDDERKRRRQAYLAGAA